MFHLVVHLCLRLRSGRTAPARLSCPRVVVVDSAGVRIDDLSPLALLLLSSCRRRCSLVGISPASLPGSSIGVIRLAGSRVDNLYPLALLLLPGRRRRRSPRCVGISPGGVPSPPIRVIGFAGGGIDNCYPIALLRSLSRGRRCCRLIRIIPCRLPGSSICVVSFARISINYRYPFASAVSIFVASRFLPQHLLLASAALIAIGLTQTMHEFLEQKPKRNLGARRKSSCSERPHCVSVRSAVLRDSLRLTNFTAAFSVDTFEIRAVRQLVSK